MKFENKVYSKIYDKNGGLLSEFVDSNLVVSQGKEIIRDCLVYWNKQTGDVVAHWSMDDNEANTTVLDTTGNHNGTCSVNTNTIYNASGKLGGCQTIDGTVINTIPDSDDLKTQAFSISLWIKFNQIESSVYGQTLFMGTGDGTWTNGYLMRQAGNKFYFNTNHWQNGQVLVSTQSLMANTWYHLVFVVNDSAVNKMYINGIEEASGPYSIVNHSFSDKKIASSVLGNLDGFIDQVLFTEGALSQSEVSALYTALELSNNGLRNITLSTDTTPPTISDTTLGGTLYETGLQSNESETNLESAMTFGTDTLEHDILNIPFKYTNSTGSELSLNKIGVFDYNGGDKRLFGALLLNDGDGTVLPIDGYILSYYEIKVVKLDSDEGYLTDWGVKAVTHALVYGNVDYKLDYVGFGSGYGGGLIVNNDIPTNNLLLHYNFDGDYNDNSGNNYHGTNSGCTFTTALTGDSGQAILQDSGSDYVSAPLEEALRVDGDLTFICYIDERDVSGDAHIMSCGSSGESLSTNILFELRRTSNYIRIFHEYGSGSNIEITTTIPINAHDILHLIIVRDVSEKKYIFYVDGIFHSEYTYAANPEKASSGNTQRWYFGKSLANNWGGIISDVMIYNRVIEAGEISSFYGTHGGSFQPSNSINSLFATTQATSILSSEANKILTSFDYTSGVGRQVEEVGVGHSDDNGTTLDLFSKFEHSKTLSASENWTDTITNAIELEE